MKGNFFFSSFHKVYQHFANLPGWHLINPYPWFMTFPMDPHAMAQCRSAHVLQNLMDDSWMVIHELQKVINRKDYTESYRKMFHQFGKNAFYSERKSNVSHTADFSSNCIFSENCAFQEKLNTGESRLQMVSVAECLRSLRTNDSSDKGHSRTVH